MNFATYTSAAVLLCASCKERSPEETSTAAALDEGADKEAVIDHTVASHLGFAAHVPAQVDIYVSGFHADKLIRKPIKMMLLDGVADPSATPESNSETSDIIDDLDDKLVYLGDEAFVYVTEEPNRILKVATQSYRDLSASSLGLIAKLTLSSASAGNGLDGPSPEDEQMLQELLDQLVNSIFKDESLRLPGLVAGWKPDPSKLQECVEHADDLISSLAQESADMEAVTFDASGASMKGYQIAGEIIFSEWIEKARLSLEEEAFEKLETTLTKEQIEGYLAALESYQFTIASGTFGDYVLIYIGSGTEGLRLAPTPEESLASSPAVTWTNRFQSSQTIGFAYVSEAMLSAWLPLIDQGPYWEEASEAIGVDFTNDRELADLMGDIAITETQLAERAPSALSSIALIDGGIRIEHRGGWPDPKLDYDRQFTLLEASSATEPVIRAHWVQNRARNDLEWKRIEQIAAMLRLGLDTYLTGEFAPIEQVPPAVIESVVSTLQQLNRSYREDFREGIDDEFALVVDFEGMMPPIPGIPAEIVNEQTIPRFVLARPVTDRDALSTAATEWERISKDLISTVNDVSGLKLPLLTPQKAESNEFDTWYYPTPISGGDFIPGVSINDKLWMVGTSRSMAKALANGGPTTDTQTGVLIEVDLKAVNQWFKELYQRHWQEFVELASQSPDLPIELQKSESAEWFKDQFRRPNKFIYRHWLDDGIPRTTIHLQVDPED